MVMEHKPIALEALDDKLTGLALMYGLHPDNIALLPPGHGWLIAEFGGDTKEESDQRARALMDACALADAARRG